MPYLHGHITQILCTCSKEQGIVCREQKDCKEVGSVASKPSHFVVLRSLASPPPQLFATCPSVILYDMYRAAITRTALQVRHASSTHVRLAVAAYRDASNRDSVPGSPLSVRSAWSNPLRSFNPSEAPSPSVGGAVGGGSGTSPSQSPSRSASVALTSAQRTAPMSYVEDDDEVQSASGHTSV